MKCTPSPPLPHRVLRVTTAAEFWRHHCAPDDNVRCERYVYTPVGRSSYGWIMMWPVLYFDPCPDGAMIHHEER